MGLVHFSPDLQGVSPRPRLTAGVAPPPLYPVIIRAALQETLSSLFPTSSDKNWFVQPNKMARGWKFFILVSRGIVLTM